MIYCFRHIDLREELEVKRHNDKTQSGESKQARAWNVVDRFFTFGKLLSVLILASVTSIVLAFFISVDKAREGFVYGGDSSIFLVAFTFIVVLGAVISYLAFFGNELKDPIVSSCADNVKDYGGIDWGLIGVSAFAVGVGSFAGFFLALIALVTVSAQSSVAIDARVNMLEDKGYADVMVVNEFDGLVRDAKTSNRISSEDMEKVDNFIAKDGDKSYLFVFKQDGERITIHKDMEVKIAEEIK